MCHICQNWARVSDPYQLRTNDGLPILPIITRQHYNDSLMEVWMSHPLGNDKLKAYSDFCPEPEFGIEVTKTQMHREVFENLPEFSGF